MWHTNNGERTLEGAEAKLFAQTLWDFLCELEIEDGDYDVGPRVFDSLTYGQKVSVLSIIGDGLLRPDEPIYQLTAAVESAIAAVFEYLKELIMLEDHEPGNASDSRKMILAARSQSGAEGLPEEECQDEQKWLMQIDELACLILWDYDFEDEDLYVDMPPEEASRLKKLMRIKDDYFIEIPDDLRPKEIEMILLGLKTLCQSVRK